MKRYLILGIVLVFSLFVFSSVSESASLQSRIIGKWVGVDSDEKVEFVKDGTIIIVTKEGVSLVGDYRFIDENRIRMDVGAPLFGKVAMVVELSIDKEGLLILTEPYGKVTKYKYTTPEETEKAEKQRKIVEPIKSLLREGQRYKLKEMGKDVVEPLIILLKDKSSILMRAEAASALGEIKDSRAVEPLIAALKDGDEGVRWCAAFALGEIKDSRAVEPLIAVLKDGNKQVRINTMWSLGEIGDSRAVEPLIAALKDEHAWVRENAAKALKKLEASANGSQSK